MFQEFAEKFSDISLINLRFLALILEAGRWKVDQRL